MVLTLTTASIVQPGHKELMKIIHASASLIALFLTIPALAAEPDDVHPKMTSKYWANIGVFFSSRNFEASANGSIAGITTEFDFESSTGLDDHPDVLMAEFGWQFSPNWSAALQYFGSERRASRVLSESLEWRDLVFDVGVRVDAETSLDVTRVFFARRFRDEGPHSLRLGAGIHWLSIRASLAGDATLNDLSTEFRRSVVKTSFPMPNVGAWYRYSPSRRWLFNVRVDWLSASVDEYDGGIWNASADVDFNLWKNVGLGLRYQFFELDGAVKEENWRGEVKQTFTGPVVYISGHW
jgi:hypothetical protein